VNSTEVSVDNQTQASRVLVGAALGAGFAFLFLTRSGQRVLNSAEPWLDAVIRDMQRLRGAAAKARDAVEEGRRSFAAMQELSPFGNKGGGFSETSH
jgi:hypothetical protein